MKIRNKFQRKAKGQDTVEMAVMLPLIIGVYILIFGFGVFGHIHQMTAALTYVGARAEGIQPGTGQAAMGAVKGVMLPNTSIELDIRNASDPTNGPYIIAKTTGVTGIHWTPWVSLDTVVRSTMTYPNWNRP